MTRPTHASDTGLARLVDAVLLPGFVGTQVPDWLAERVAAGLAGVCVFAHNVASPDQLASLSADLHALRPFVLVASDEEGGDVTRLEHGSGSSWPGNAALGVLDDVDATRAVAAAMGRQARRAGIDLPLAPVVDVNTDPDNPVIGIRAFGATPDLVARHARAFVEGLQSAGVAACAKHFPGHGDTSVDSHLDLPVVDVELATLRARDLPPFAAAVDAGVRAVLTAHVRFPALDDAPATLSAPVLGLLREDLGFGGVVVSDALDMRAISADIGRGPGAVRALAAGVDLVCIGNPCFPDPYDDVRVLDEVRDRVVAAVADGVLDVTRLEAAASRVAELGRWSALPPPDVGPQADDAALGADVARRVVESSGDVRLDGVPVVVDLRTRTNVAAGRQPLRLLDVLSERVPGVTAVVLAADVDPASAVTAGLPADSRPVVAVVDAPHRDVRQAAMLAALLTARPDAVTVLTGLPDGRQRLGWRWVRAWGAGRANAAAAADLLLP